MLRRSWKLPVIALAALAVTAAAVLFSALPEEGVPEGNRHLTAASDGEGQLTFCPEEGGYILTCPDDGHTEKILLWPYPDLPSCQG